MKVPFNDARWAWSNEPAHATTSSDGSELQVLTNAGLDWWRLPSRTVEDGETYTFQVAAGDAARDFTASVSVKGKYKQTFDQATIFLHVSWDGNSRWCKAGPEREENRNWIGSVVTVAHSDWAISAPPESQATVINDDTWIRVSLKRVGDMLSIRTGCDDEKVSEARRDVNGFFFGVPSDAKLCLGVMACQPSKEKQGVSATFKDFEISND